MQGEDFGSWGASGKKYLSGRHPSTSLQSQALVFEPSSGPAFPAASQETEQAPLAPFSAGCQCITCSKTFP